MLRVNQTQYKIFLVTTCFFFTCFVPPFCLMRNEICMHQREHLNHSLWVFGFFCSTTSDLQQAVAFFDEVRPDSAVLTFEHVFFSTECIQIYEKKTVPLWVACEISLGAYLCMNYWTTYAITFVGRSIISRFVVNVVNDDNAWVWCLILAGFKLCSVNIILFTILFSIIENPY